MRPMFDWKMGGETSKCQKSEGVVMWKLYKKLVYNEYLLQEVELTKANPKYHTRAYLDVKHSKYRKSIGTVT